MAFGWGDLACTPCVDFVELNTIWIKINNMATSDPGGYTWMRSNCLDPGPRQGDWSGMEESEAVLCLLTSKHAADLGHLAENYGHLAEWIICN